jgi:hypothetical protein
MTYSFPVREVFRHFASHIPESNAGAWVVAIAPAASAATLNGCPDKSSHAWAGRSNPATGSILNCVCGNSLKAPDWPLSVKVSMNW